MIFGISESAAREGGKERFRLLGPPPSIAVDIKPRRKRRIEVSAWNEREDGAQPGTHGGRVAGGRRNCKHDHLQGVGGFFSLYRGLSHDNGYARTAFGGDGGLHAIAFPRKSFSEKLGPPQRDDYFGPAGSLGKRPTLERMGQFWWDPGCPPRQALWGAARLELKEINSRDVAKK